MSQTTETVQETKPKPRKSPRGMILFLIVIAIVGFVVAQWWMKSNAVESTDDAQVNSHLNSVSARVAGVVSTVNVEENQFVKAGDTIAELDPRDFQNTLDQVQSQLAQSQTQVRASAPNVPLTETTNRFSVSGTEAEIASAMAAMAVSQRDVEAAEANVREAEANLARAQADVARYQPLAAKDEVPRMQFDQIAANAKALAAVVESKQAVAASARKIVDQRRSVVTQLRVKLDEAKALAPQLITLRKADITTRQAAVSSIAPQIERAKLDLSYTKIVAPVSGIVTRRTVEIGQRVNPGQQLVQIAQVGDLWVTANFKETQLRRIKTGQHVKIHIDAFNREWDGHVESMPASTGSILSLLPPENATGNFVKTIQRLPVRIRFEPGQQGLDALRPGMSAEPSVQVQ